MSHCCNRGCRKVGVSSKCSKCGVVSYCSRECQASDWPAWHKVQCKVIRRASKMLEQKDFDVGGPSLFTERTDDGTLSQAFTIAAAVSTSNIALGNDHGPQQPLRVALIGARSHVEGRLDFGMVKLLISRILPGLKAVRFTLHGPEVNPTPTLTTKGLSVVHVPGKYQPSWKDKEPHIACLLNAGIDEHFNDWAPSLNALQAMNIPCVFTGYLGVDEAGCERLLRLMEWDVAVPTTRSPFGWDVKLSGSIRDSFMVVAKGKAPDAKKKVHKNLKEVQRKERIERLNDLAKLNDPVTASRLLKLAEGLADRSINLPSTVTHTDMETWAQGIWK